MTSRPRRRSGALGIGRALSIFVAVVGIGFLALRSEIGQTLFGDWSFVKSVEQDQGTYYRLKVKLTYKGEPQDFDIPGRLQPAAHHLQGQQQHLRGGSHSDCVRPPDVRR